MSAEPTASLGAIDLTVNFLFCFVGFFLNTYFPTVANRNLWESHGRGPSNMKKHEQKNLY